MNDAHHTSGVTCGRGLISCVSLTVPSGKPRAALDWFHVIPIGSSPPHVRLNCAAQPPDPTPSHFCPVRLCADIFIIKKSNYTVEGWHRFWPWCLQPVAVNKELNGFKYILDTAVIMVGRTFTVLKVTGKK